VFSSQCEGAVITVPTSAGPRRNAKALEFARRRAAYLFNEVNKE
jgi:hypothetical protein